MKLHFKTSLSCLLIVLSLEAISQKKDSTSVSVDSLNLNQKIIPLGDIRETSLVTGSDLVNSEFIGSWPMFGTDMRMKLGGYVKTDMIYDVDGTLDQTQFLMSTIPVEGQPEYGNSGYFSFIARETRFNIDIRRVTKGSVPLKMFIEGDFWSQGNQFRLRHAYIVAGEFIIGQTWTTLSILESLPVMIDFAAGDALFGGRTSQVRWQRKVNKNLQLAAALEKIPFIGIENPNNYAGMASSALPLVALRMDYSWNSGVLFLGSSAAQLRWDGGDNGPVVKALQWDVVFAGRQYAGKKNFFTWNVSYGVGSGENIMAFAGSSANAVLVDSTKLETMPALSVLVGYMHKWTDNLSSNFSYAYGWLETPDSRAPFALMKGGVGHVNLIYRPVKQFATGIEYIWGAQRTANDNLGRASRIQAMARFDF